MCFIRDLNDKQLKILSDISSGLSLYFGCANYTFMSLRTNKRGFYYGFDFVNLQTKPNLKLSFLKAVKDTVCVAKFIVEFFNLCILFNV